MEVPVICAIPGSAGQHLPGGPPGGEQVHGQSRVELCEPPGVGVGQRGLYRLVVRSRARVEEPWRLLGTPRRRIAHDEQRNAR